MNACQCASMRPGMSTRPFAAITRTLAPASTVIGPAEMRAMALPRTRTLHGGESASLLPNCGHFEKASAEDWPACQTVPTWRFQIGIALRQA
jgi:hypothetical protein